ncbi:MAG: two-component system, response regulator PdtaR [Clostridia bacterium]|nr:two-component system, response regulator PdtaR [Clostridia bacterium]
MISLKILIADDDFLTRMDLQEMLTEMKHTVVGTAKNGREALELTHKFRPDMVIMDVKMPKMDGLKAAN